MVRQSSGISTGSSPPQFVIVAGIEAAASSPGVWSKMSSSWMGLHTLARSGKSGIG